ncbi:hypothetical protein [Hyalangium gracile]|uniref:hypothetical protein n=1 Tax=Hyalangium gracile TaxID=394092 RepID=UPI001CCEFA8A|nr:hypothetical protein [Hyalangium gracile]
MVKARSTNLWALCWLGLMLMVLLPESAFAQRRGRSRGGGGGSVPEDPLCYRTHYGICQKFRIGVVGGGILSTDGASSGLGMQLGYTVVLAPRIELGGSVLVVKDLRFEEGPVLGTAEAVLRMATITGPNHRLFLDVAAGFSRYDSPERAYWAFPSASAGASLELSTPGVGIFLSGGMALMWAEGVTALPHAGIGLAF